MAYLHRNWQWVKSREWSLSKTIFFIMSRGCSFRFSHVRGATYRINETSAHGLKRPDHFTSRCITQLNGYLTQRAHDSNAVDWREKWERWYNNWHWQWVERELETYCSAIFVTPNILYILIINKIDNNL